MKVVVKLIHRCQVLYPHDVSYILQESLPAFIKEIEAELPIDKNKAAAICEFQHCLTARYMTLCLLQRKVSIFVFLDNT